MTNSPRFSLRFSPKQLTSLSEQYDYTEDDSIGETIGRRACERGYYTRKEFLILCRWKTPRSQSRCSRNSPRLIREVSRIALSSAYEEQVRIGILTILEGVSWPTASVLLHFGCHNLYPILDYRALWSLGVNKPPICNFEYWWAYTTHCRSLAKRFHVTMRVLDRALWQYSKTNQPSARSSQMSFGPLHALKRAQNGDASRSSTPFQPLDR